MLQINWCVKREDSKHCGEPDMSYPSWKEIRQGAITNTYSFMNPWYYPMWKIRSGLGIEGLVEELHHAYDGTEAVYCHWDMDVLGGAGPAPGDILGELAEPFGMSDYEVIRLAHEVGRRGIAALSFICIPPGSPAIYRVLVYVIMYMAAGLAMKKIEEGSK